VRLLARLDGARTSRRFGWPSYPLGRRAGLLASGQRRFGGMIGRPAARIELQESGSDRAVQPAAASP
jgi:hypothetical protein